MGCLILLVCSRSLSSVLLIAAANEFLPVEYPAAPVTGARGESLLAEEAAPAAAVPKVAPAISAALSLRLPLPVLLFF